jgi:molecular chaperone DnaJ
VSRSPFGQVVRQVPCDVCGGDGRVAQQPCTRCDGRGREVRRRTLAVDVPAGIADGQRIRLSGRGHAGERGGPPGDLYVRVHVRPDERFVRDGDDLVTVLDVPVALAALGAELEVPTLDGPRPLEIPAGTQPGEIFRLKGQGMPVLRRPGRRGDLRVVADVVVPRRLSREQRELLERLAETTSAGDGERSDESVLGKLRRLLHG